LRATAGIKSDPARGRALFDALGCVKCHTIDRAEEPRGPFLGDVGGKFDAKYLAESIMKPAAKIAQGFASERVVAAAAVPASSANDGRATDVVAALSSPTASASPSSSSGSTDFTGFVTKETADEVHLRDLTGRVTIIRKEQITRRSPLPGSMMPDGLVDALTLDDFAALMNFLTSLK
jgi:cytochrome c551/c552